MDLSWFLLAVPLAGVVFVVVGLCRTSSAYRERCPFRVGTDRIECACPCQAHPPCHFV
jgi:hypothetical protein